MSLEASKIATGHLARKAYLYVRQSTPRQILDNTESTKRQYALKQRAVALGWPVDQIVVIDNDLGHSAASVADREGFRQMVAEVTMGRVGIVMGLEVSRLARNSADWHRLLEICSFTDTLILDEDGIYNPASFNDRLLLGLKGTMSEAELHLMRMRLRGGLLTKAKRGELAQVLPVGFVYNDQNQVVLDPDTLIQECVRLALSTFEREGSAHAVLKYFRSKNLFWPCRPPMGPRQHEVYWRPIRRFHVIAMLKNPRYAGTYFFGRARHSKDPATGRRTQRLVPRDEWHALIPGAHIGYISWEQYEKNQLTLERNAKARVVELKAPPREGPALLQGLALCGNCGRRMSLRYHLRKGALIPDYLCQDLLPYDQRKACMSVPGASVDAAVSEVLLEAVSPMALEVSMAVDQELRVRLEEVDRLRQKQVERAQYEASLAERRYKFVDPANRLVADSLEAEWNVKIRDLNEAVSEYERQRVVDRQVLSDAEQAKVRELATEFPRLWNDPHVSDRDRKRIIHLIVEDVTLRRDKEVTILIRFKGGLTRTITAPLAKTGWQLHMTPPETLAEIDRLLNDHTDREVAQILNERGVPTGTGKKFTTVIVLFLRTHHGIPGRYERLRQAGMLTCTELMQMFDADIRRIAAAREDGTLRAHRANQREYLYEPPAADAAQHIPKRIIRRKSGSQELSA
jgi:DNA invertase Pin-like site-specific DNA recombinase